MSYKGFEPCFIHSRRRLSRNSFAQIPELTTTSTLILWSVQKNALVHDWGFPLWAMANWLCSYLPTPAVHYIDSCVLSTSIWSYSHLAACYIFLLWRLVLYTIFACGSWVLCPVAAIAASWWTICCPRCCCVSPSCKLDVMPVLRLNSDPIGPGGGDYGATPWCWGKVRKMITKSSGKS